MNSISVIIPIVNEEEILKRNIDSLVPSLRKDFDKVEVILTENGSVDQTKEIAKMIPQEYSEVIAIIDDGIADYGQALIKGIQRARYDKVSILELDYLDLDFLKRSYALLAEYDLIIGSKKINRHIDQRSWQRKLFTNLYNLLLRWMFRLKVTETHGLKTFKKSKLKEIVETCVTRHAVFPSELVIRAARDASLKVCEIPLSLPLKEVRKTRISAGKRLKKTLGDLVLLRQALKK